MNTTGKEQILKDLIVKKDTLILLVAKLTEIPAVVEEEAEAKKEMIEIISYWIGAAQVYIDGKILENHISMDAEKILAGIDGILASFKR